MHYFKILLFLICYSHYLITDGTLLYPANTVFQITTSFSAPVEIPDIKLWIDWGFQVNYNMPFSLDNFYKIAKWPGISRQQSRAIDYNKYDYVSLNGSHPSDMSAGELYMALEDIMVDYGYHESCLLKSVCEVAKHPFDLGEENLLAEVLTFILSPSIHQSFAENEKAYKHAYEAAEKYGASDLDCSYVYRECPSDFINLITKVLYDES